MFQAVMGEINRVPVAAPCMSFGDAWADALAWMRVYGTIYIMVEYIPVGRGRL